ncbi:MAG: hypothetical protein P1S46_06585 [bacterium]|nr:hypothetical protein [bacterium]MDT8396080.1 hypothetical protein [bacterium]
MSLKADPRTSNTPVVIVAGQKRSPAIDLEGTIRWTTTVKGEQSHGAGVQFLKPGDRVARLIRQYVESVNM